MATLVSCVRPTIVNRSPRSTVVFARMGIEVAVAPRVIFRRKTPRISGMLGQFGEGLAVDRLVAHQDVDALHRHGQQLAILDLGRALAEQRHQHLASARDGQDVAFLQDGVGARLLRSSRCGAGAARRRARQAPALRPRSHAGPRLFHPSPRGTPALPSGATPCPVHRFPCCRRRTSPRSPCRRRRDRCRGAWDRGRRSRPPSPSCRTCSSPRRRPASSR